MFNTNSSSGANTFSYEFFPPRSVRMERRLWRAVGQLERLRPRFLSMTYGAQGSAQAISVDSAIALHRDSPIPVAAHLTCADSNREALNRVVDRFESEGIHRIVALRGDTVAKQEGDCSYAYPSAVELVAALRERGDFDISVAAYPECHPQALSPAADLAHLKRKFDAGATRAITQYFFEADCYLRFRDAALREGIEHPIVPGILPIHDLDKVREFSRRCGASVPAHYDDLYARVGQNAAARYSLSLELAVRLCERLAKEGVDHFHLYTLNQTDICLDISLALGARVYPARVKAA